MDIGISTASFFTKLNTEDTFSVLKDFNVPVCEVFLSCISEYEGEYAERILQNKTIDVWSVHSLTNQYEPELFSKNPRAQYDAEQMMRKVLSMGQKLGAKYNTFHGATRLKKIDYNLDYTRLASIVNHLINVCGEYGIQLSYETVHWAYYSEPEYFEQLKARCPELKATMDIKQIMQANRDYSEFLPAMSDRLSTVHLCDYDSNRKLYIPGKGEFDFITLFKRLKDIGFEGTCLMEVYPQGYDNIIEIKQSYEYLIECNAKANIM